MRGFEPQTTWEQTMGPTILLNIHWSSPVYTKLSVVHFTLSDYRNYINFLEWVFRYPMNRILPFHNRTCWNGNAYQNRKFKFQSINVRVVIIIFNIKHPWNSFCQFWIPMTKANPAFALTNTGKVFLTIPMAKPQNKHYLTSFE